MSHFIHLFVHVAILADGFDEQELLVLGEHHAVSVVASEVAEVPDCHVEGPADDQGAQRHMQFIGVYIIHRQVVEGHEQVLVG